MPNNTYRVFAAMLLAFWSPACLSYRLPKETKGNAWHSRLYERLAQEKELVIAKATRGLVFISVEKPGPTTHISPLFEDLFRFFGDPRGQHPEQPRKQEGIGSGFLVDLAKGYILTNNHVIADAETISVKLANGKSYACKVIGSDATTDVAVIQIKGKFDSSNLEALVLGDPNEIKVGLDVIAVGAPFLLPESASSGIISAVGRGNLSLAQRGNFIQTDAAINPGNSGGPLISLVSSHVIGLNTAIYSKSGAHNGIGFAVPVDILKNVAESLINTGKVTMGYLGIGYQMVPKEWFGSLRIPADTSGVIVTHVDPKGPARKAGILPRDVITAVDGKEFSATNFRSVISLRRPGEVVSLDFYRDGQRQTAKVKIGSFSDPQSKHALGSSKSSTANRFGLTVSGLNSGYRQRYALTSKNGVVVLAVANRSPAAQAGLKEGDLIVSSNSTVFRSADGFSRFVAGKQSILLRIERRGNFSFVHLKTDK